MECKIAWVARESLRKLKHKYQKDKTNEVFLSFKLASNGNNGQSINTDKIDKLKVN